MLTYERNNFVYPYLCRLFDKPFKTVVILCWRNGKAKSVISFGFFVFAMTDFRRTVLNRIACNHGFSNVSLSVRDVNNAAFVQPQHLYAMPRFVSVKNNYGRRNILTKKKRCHI